MQILLLLCFSFVNLFASKPAVATTATSATAASEKAEKDIKSGISAWDYATFLRTKEYDPGFLNQITADTANGIISKDMWEDISRDYFLQFDEDIDSYLQIHTYIPIQVLKQYKKLPMSVPFAALEKDPNVRFGAYYQPLLIWLIDHFSREGRSEQEILKYIRAALKIKGLTVNEFTAKVNEKNELILQPKTLLDLVDSKGYELIAWLLIRYGAKTYKELEYEKNKGVGERPVSFTKRRYSMEHAQNQKPAEERRHSID